MLACVRRGLMCACLLAPASPFAAGSASQDAVRPSSETQDPETDSTAVERPTFRTSATLVTVDAVVTDKDGRHVTDLTADDFEVVHAGKRQQLRHAVYVPLGSLTRPDDGLPGEASGTAAPRRAAGALSRAVAGRPAPAKRTIAVVVDDLGLSFESTANVRRGLRRFVDEQVGPGDLVAIVRTSGGIGTLQQFTRDKRLLHAAVDRVRWTVTSRAGVGAFAPIEPRDRFTVFNDPTRTEGSVGRGERELGASYAEDSLHAVRHSVLAAGSLGALDFVVRGVENLPGRKAVVFVSEGFDLFSRKGEAHVWAAFTRLMDHANRAGVVVYTIDGRGLETAGLSAEDNPQLDIPMMPGEGNDGDRRLRELIFGAQDARQAVRRNSEEALHYVAWQTGGFTILNNNDVGAAMRRVIDDLQGYYLLGYAAPEGTPPGWDPDRIRVSVKRTRVRVRSRRGFFGPADPERDTTLPRSDPLLLAAMSPFGSAAITLRLTALFAHDQATGPYVRSLLFIEPSGLTFTRGADGRHEAAAEIAQFAVGENGELVGDWRRRLTLRLTDDELSRARQTGVVYSTRMSVKEPGGYQVRVGVMDVASGAVGSASQFLEVPKVGRGRLAMSGLLLRAEANDDGARVRRPRLEPDPIDPEVLGKPALRIFQPGARVAFAYELYDGASVDDPLAASASLLRDGRVVFQGEPEPIERPKEADSGVRVIPVGGTLSIGEQVPPGIYTLEVNVASGRKRRAAQWIDIEVRR